MELMQINHACMDLSRYIQVSQSAEHSYRVEERARKSKALMA